MHNGIGPPVVQRYCCVSLQVFPFGSDSALVISNDTGSTQMLSLSVLDLLSNLSGFKTLRQHAIDACLRYKLAPVDVLLNQRFPSVLGKAIYQFRNYMEQHGEKVIASRRIEGLEHQLADLVDLRLMVSEEDCLARAAKFTEPLEERTDIRSVGVVTRDRPEALLRCLTSFVRNSQQHGREMSFTVFDDSDANIRMRNRVNLAKLSCLSKKATFAYAGAEEKTKYKTILIESGEVPPDVVDFTLFDPNRCGRSYGANLNALLLHHLGAKVITLDDDVVCQLAQATDYHPGLAFVSSHDPTECWFYADRQSALESTSFTEIDFISLHEALLGRRIDGCINRAATQGVDLSLTGPGSVGGLLAQSGMVRATMSGLLGDAGVTAPGWFTITGPSRDRILKSESIYRSAFTSREIARGVRRNVITDGAFFMNYAAGLDNRTLLPPFFPVMRNTDGVFAATLRTCLKDTYLGHIPWMVMHDPPEQRSSKSLVMLDIFGPRISEIIILAVNSFPTHLTLEPGEAIRSLGGYLCELASLPLSDFEHWLHLQLCHQMSSTVRWLDQEIYQHVDPPLYWREDVSSFISGMQEFVTRPECMVARDLLEGRSVAEARTLTRDLVRQYGRLLTWWPELCSLCSRLQSSGVYLAQEIR